MSALLVLRLNSEFLAGHNSDFTRKTDEEQIHRQGDTVTVVCDMSSKYNKQGGRAEQ